MENFFGNISNEIIVNMANYSPILLKKIAYLLIFCFSYNPVKDFLLGSLKKILIKTNLDELLINFLLTTTKFMIIVFYFLNLLDILGLKTVSLLALIGSVGVGIGLALKGSLSDVAGGIQILISKPFKKGDYIVAAGTEGSVQKINFLYTILNSGDNKKIIIPNGKLSSSIVTTVTANPQRRADFLFFVDKKSNIDHVREIIFDIVNNHPSVLKDRDVFVKFGKETSTALEFIVRIWTLKQNFRDLNADIQEEIKKRFDKDGIRIPYQSYEIKKYL